MSSASRMLLRPFARAAVSAPRQAIRPAMSFMSTQSKPAVQSQPIKNTRVAIPETPKAQKANVNGALMAAMPQLVPFYFVNEVTFAFVLIPSMIYVFSKYLLPQRVRAQAARFFITKL